jgi:hypothetical protein
VSRPTTRIWRRFGQDWEVIAIVILELLRRQVFHIGNVVAVVEHVPGDRIFHQGAVDAVRTAKIKDIYGSTLDLIPGLDQLHEDRVRQMRDGVVQPAKDSIVHPRVSLKVELAKVRSVQFGKRKRINSLRRRHRVIPRPSFLYIC